MNNLFQYVPGNSVIHRMNPVTKIFLTIVICIAAFVSGNLFYLAGLLAVDLLIGFIAGVPGKTLTIFKGLLKIALFLFVLIIFRRYELQRCNPFFSHSKKSTDVVIIS